MHAKERLTGAIILVVLIVLVVPELLTGPRRAESPDAETSVEGAPMRSYTIELGERNASRPAQPATTTQTTPTTQTTKTPETVATPEASASEPSKSSESSASSEPAPATGWSVQVGSFAKRENAERLTGELQQLGFRSFVTEGEAGGRKLYRVRVGPASDRESAQKLAERLQAAKHPGSVVPHP